MRNILEKFKSGEIPLNEVENGIKVLAIEKIENMAKLDIGHEFRQGRPEIIDSEGKRPEDITKIAVGILRNKGRVIISHAMSKMTDTIINRITANFSLGEVQVDSRARVIIIKKKNFVLKKTGGKVGILTAGTSDIPVAEEAFVIAEEMGCKVIAAYDVGVDAIQRLYPALKMMIENEVDVAIVIAGKEASLPNVVAGNVDFPVIGVPTSIGSGFGGKGIGALMSMLLACSRGIAVVNIDCGLEAAIIASLFANRVARFRNKCSL